VRLGRTLRAAARNHLPRLLPRLFRALAPVLWCRYRVVVPLELNPRGRQICLFAHFDRQSLIDDYVVYYLEQLVLAGLDILFITTSQPSTGEYARIAPLCAGILERENIGIDFGSWRTALLTYPQLTTARLLVFANDSVYGPLGPLAPILKRLTDADCDFFGITESLDMQSHFQSYFLGFKASCLTTPAFSRLMGGIELLPDKLAVIHQYEVTLKGQLEAAGLRGLALVPGTPGDLDNPTLRYWREVIERSSPFLKVELLRDTPRRVSIAGWPDTVRSHGYDPALIERHLLRVGATRDDDRR